MPKKTLKWASYQWESFARGQRRTAVGILLKHSLANWLLPWNLPTYLHLRKVIKMTTVLLRGAGFEWRGFTESAISAVQFSYSEACRLKRPKLGFLRPAKETNAEN